MLFTKQQIIKLKLTKRIIRLLLVILLINVLLGIIDLLFLTLGIYIIPFIIMLSNIINKPLEEHIKRKYLKKAKEKLNYINPLVVGITGSFGKTTVKNFVYSLSDNLNTCMSKRSYNTEMGTCRSILEDLDYSDEIFIAELGATKSKDIEILSKFVAPSIGVITDIGNQHIESFKTIENILNTKLEILKSPNIKTLIINSDNKYLNEFSYPRNINIIRVGKNIDADIRFTNINYNFDKTTFDLIDGLIYPVETKVLGIHNILNIVMAYAVLKTINAEEKEVINKIKDLENPKNRLEIKHINNHTIIDNSFNSNISGFLNNIDLLSKSKDYKVIITPGVVELNKSSKKEHIKIANAIIDKIDFVYLINNKNTRYMKKEFDLKGFKNYYLCDTFKEAFNKAIDSKKPSTILIENDLTDYYLNGGI